MHITHVSNFTSEQAFWIAHTCLVQRPLEASLGDGGKNKGINSGLDLLELLHMLLQQQIGKSLSIDHSSTIRCKTETLVWLRLNCTSCMQELQFTRNQVRVGVVHQMIG